MHLAKNYFSYMRLKFIFLDFFWRILKSAQICHSNFFLGQLAQKYHPYGKILWNEANEMSIHRKNYKADNEGWPGLNANPHQNYPLYPTKPISPESPENFLLGRQKRKFRAQPKIHNKPKFFEKTQNDQNWGQYSDNFPWISEKIITTIGK